MIKSLIEINGKRLAVIGISDDDCDVLRQRETLVAELDFVDDKFAKDVIVFIRVPDSSSELIINTVLDAGINEIITHPDVDEIKAVAMIDSTLDNYGHCHYVMEFKGTKIEVLVTRTDTDDNFFSVLLELQQEHSKKRCKFEVPEDVIYPTDPSLN